MAISDSRQLLRTVYNFEIRLAFVTDRVCRIAQASLSWIGPTLARRAIPGKASLARTILGLRVDAHTNVWIAAHKAKVVSRALLASIFAVAKLEEGLWLPLTISAPLSVSA